MTPIDGRSADSRTGTVPERLAVLADIRAALEAWCALPDIRKRMIEQPPAPPPELCPCCRQPLHPGGQCIEIAVAAAVEPSIPYATERLKRPEFIEENYRGWNRL